MTTLGLDLGQSIGWVKGAAVGPMTFGTFEMPKTTDLGKWLRGSDGFFRDVLADTTSIAVEQPFLGQDYFPARKLISLLGHVHYWAGWQGVAVVNEIAIVSGKLNLSGHGNATAEEMIAAAAERYGLALNEHEAHALGIWDVHVFGRQAAPRRKPKSSKGVRVT